MLWVLQVSEQRYRAVQEVLNGASVTAVARRFTVSRQTVHAWLNRYAADGGLAGLGIGRRGRTAARTRWLRWWRPGSWRFGGRTRCGGRIGSDTSWRRTGSARCRVGAVSIGR